MVLALQTTWSNSKTCPVMPLQHLSMDCSRAWCSSGTRPTCACCCLTESLINAETCSKASGDSSHARQIATQLGPICRNVKQAAYWRHFTAWPAVAYRYVSMRHGDEGSRHTGKIRFLQAALKYVSQPHAIQCYSSVRRTVSWTYATLQGNTCSWGSQTVLQLSSRCCTSCTASVGGGQWHM